jgi:hypothetical protein
MPKGTNGWVRGQKVVPADVVVRHLTPDNAKQNFLARFEALRPAYLLRRCIRVTQGVEKDFVSVSGLREKPVIRP